VNELKKKSEQGRPTAVDLFAGSGGLSLGFEKAGFRVIAANEVWEPATRTYAHNFPEVALVEGDIREEPTKKQLSSEVRNQIGRIPPDVVIGGPPCQGFSTSGYRDVNDDRAKLFYSFFDLVRDLEPKVFVMENVRGILSAKTPRRDLNEKQRAEFRAASHAIYRYKKLRRIRSQRDLEPEEGQFLETYASKSKYYKKTINKCLVPVVAVIHEIATELGYSLQQFVLRATDYGVPQKRVRVFFVGNRLGVELDSPGEIPLIETPRSLLQDLERKPEDYLPNHNYTRHSAKFVSRIRATPPGKGVYKNYNSAWIRLEPDKPAPTVKENHGGVLIHYKEDRACTPRELARLQDFPDSFVFKGTKSAVLKLIGNAVPPALGRVIGEQVLAALSIDQKEEIKEEIPPRISLVAS